MLGSVCLCVDVGVIYEDIGVSFVWDCLSYYWLVFIVESWTLRRSFLSLLVSHMGFVCGGCCVFHHILSICQPDRIWSAYQQTANTSTVEQTHTGTITNQLCGHLFGSFDSLPVHLSEMQCIPTQLSRPSTRPYTNTAQLPLHTLTHTHKHAVFCLTRRCPN